MSARPQRGFSLIEILITLAVISFGIVAHLMFQRITFHEAGLATNRARAAEEAEKKIEDLRTFGCLKTAACSFAFQDIATNAGGTLNASGHLIQPSATAFKVDNTSFTRSWVVTDYWYTATNSAATTTAPPATPAPLPKEKDYGYHWYPPTTAPPATPTPLPSLKQVTVSVNWTDSNGNAQVLKLSSEIAGADPAAEARVYQ